MSRATLQPATTTHVPRTEFDNQAKGPCRATLQPTTTTGMPRRRDGVDGVWVGWCWSPRLGGRGITVEWSMCSLTRT